MGMRPLLPLIALAATGCSDMEMSSKQGYDDYGPEDADTGYWYGGETSEEPNTDDDLGSEVENDFLRLVPATTDKYVFVANPARNTVTRVSVPSLDVITVEQADNENSVVTQPGTKRSKNFCDDGGFVVDQGVPSQNPAE